VAFRSSVTAVCGTRQNTWRSPSVMRLVSISWVCPDTAETPGMRCHRTTSSRLTAGSSVHLTAITTSLLMVAALLAVSPDGGLENAPKIALLLLPAASGRSPMFSSAACWSVSTRHQQYCTHTPALGVLGVGFSFAPWRPLANPNPNPNLNPNFYRLYSFAFSLMEEKR